MATYVENKYLKHWSLFAEAFNISLQSIITRNELAHHENLVDTFLLDIKKLYSIDAMTFNVHLLMH